MTLPHWSLSKLYPSLDSKEFQNDLAKVPALAEKFEAFQTSDNLLATLKLYIALQEEASDLFGSILLYCHSFISTDSYNTKAAKIASSLAPYHIKTRSAEVRFQKWLAALPEKRWLAFWKSCEAAELKDFRFAFEETRKRALHLMSEKEEALAAKLNQCGAEAWTKLHGIITSRLTAEFETEEGIKRLPVTAIRGYKGSPDPEVRLRAQKTEEAAWKTVEDQLAACLNGVKGSAVTLAKARGYKSPLEESLTLSRLDQETFDAMFLAMRNSFPLFRRYYKAKAKMLGLPSLRWCDLSAPVGDSSRRYTYEEARDFVLRQFATFHPELEALGKRAFAENWIDAEPRDGKRGGAFCSPVRRLEESRILANFNGSFDSVNCLAHELGHAFHNYCLRNLPSLQRGTPMTLAETASINNEMICGLAAVKEAKSAGEEAYLLENILQSTSSVIVDISSRFLFESEVMEKREHYELTAAELCEIMMRSQKETYGDALDPNHLGPYIWTWKPHYYFSGVNFYNYPYAFGRLFALSLYAIYEKEGAAFVPEYMKLLGDCGRYSPRELAARFGYDLSQASFWEGSLALVEKWVEQFENLAKSC